jgi:hypothetical protein
MFAFLIIGSEIVILYFVYWVVFIREPKFHEMREDLWGRYQHRSNMTNKADVDLSIPSFSRPGKLKAFLPSRIRARLYRMTKGRRRQQHNHMKHSCSCGCREKRSASSWQGAAASSRREVNQQLAERFLSILNRTLNKFSIKISL